MVSIINIKKETKPCVYIGRGSIFGNPYHIGIDGDRDQVCDAYEDYFYKKLKTDVVFKDTLDNLKGKDVVLGCYCKPKRCHGETIKRYLEE